jgi:NADH:ubiquinone oxidoreductase subunit C
MAIDVFAIDCIENEYRFTIIYNIQSYLSNSSIKIVTKTSNNLPLISLQNLYAAFN